jgi:Ni/Fe-hydrogenase subunit HybB-like protein
MTVFWPTSNMPGHSLRLIEFINGPYAWAFLPVLVLGIGAFALLAKRSTRHLPAVQLTASVMYVVAIFLKRYALMSMGFSKTTLGQPTGLYFPSTVETFLALGLLALGLLIVTAAVKVLPLESPEHEEGHGSHGTATQPSLEAEVVAQ